MEENNLNPDIQTNINDTSPSNPWLLIWYKPSQAFKLYLDNKPELMMIPLVLIGGFQRYLILSYDKNIGDMFSLPIVLLLAVTLGSLFLGLFGLYVGSHILRETGKWIGGRGTLDGIKAAYAWSYTPAIFALILWMIVFAIWGPAILKSKPISVNADIIMLVIALINLWSTITFVICLREVQQFSMLRAIANVVMSFLVIMIVFMVLFSLHPLMRFF